MTDQNNDKTRAATVWTQIKITRTCLNNMFLSKNQISRIFKNHLLLKNDNDRAVKFVLKLLEFAFWSDWFLREFHLGFEYEFSNYE